MEKTDTTIYLKKKTKRIPKKKKHCKTKKSQYNNE